MTGKIAISLLLGLTVVSTTSFAASTDGAGTHRRDSMEASELMRTDNLESHIHKAQKHASLYTNHEDVNPAAKDLDREVRRVDEKNERGRSSL